MIDVYASERHYLAHLLPIYGALPLEVRGAVYAPRHVSASSPVPARGGIPKGRLALVASIQDLRAVRRRGVPAVFVEHGAGQSYGGSPESARHPSYSGGTARSGVVGYVVPGEVVAGRCRAAQPEVPAYPVGCPYLDPYHPNVRIAGGETPPSTVALSFHVDLPLCPETRSAFPHYRERLTRLRADMPHVRLLGHGHPRNFAVLSRFWRAHDIEPVEDFTDILERADLYVCDNSSTLVEFASTGRPVLFLDAPWYRPDVDHGGRYWEWPGEQVRIGNTDLLPEAIDLALEDWPRARQSRLQMVESVYYATDGHASERAAAAVLDLIRLAA